MIAPELRRWLAVGSGIGIEIQRDDLLITIVRVRFGRVEVLDEHRITDFPSRPAAEWGEEYNRFVSSRSLGHLAAHVLLPRESLILRLLSFPAINKKGLAAAIGFQLDSLHPYEEQEVFHAWAELERRGEVLIAIARRDVINRYETLFAEAGIQVAALGVDAAAFYSSMRMFGSVADTDFVALDASENGVEVYGESATKALFSAFIAGSVERAATIARSELRLSPEREPVPLPAMLPTAENRLAAASSTDGGQLVFGGPASEAHAQAVDGSVAVASAILSSPKERSQCSSRSYAAALNAACPWLALQVNLLPKEARKSNSRLLYLPTAVLAVLLIVCALLLAGESAWEQKRYLTRLSAEISRVEPIAGRAQQLQRSSDEMTKKTQEVDSFRSRIRADLDAIDELTRILPPPTWVSSLDMNRTSVSLSGETPDAAGLLKTMDASPLFQSSAFQQSITRNSAKGDLFRVKTQREQVVP